jgi:hypothetical protein
MLQVPFRKKTITVNFYVLASAYRKNIPPLQGFDRLIIAACRTQFDNKTTVTPADNEYTRSPQ